MCGVDLGFTLSKLVVTILGAWYCRLADRGCGVYVSVCLCLCESVGEYWRLRNWTRGSSSGGSKDVAGAMAGGKAGSTRPVSVQGRYLRLGTASMLSSGGDPSRFINLDTLDFKKYVKRPALAKVTVLHSCF
jgi:hypothetical protein